MLIIYIYSIQNNLKQELIETDEIGVDNINKITKIGGLDISVSKINKSVAIAALVVLDFNTLNILYEKYEMVTMTQPYVPGFLAFREVEHLKKLVDELKSNQPDLVPEIFLIDGNGILHTNRFGLACHLGVLCDIPTIGCGKTVFAVDGITVNRVYYQKYKNDLKNKGDFMYLKGKSGQVWGAALQSTNYSKDPIIVSIGHKISLDTAIKIVDKATKYKVVEPVRLADINSRQLIRKYDKENYEEEYLNDKNENDYEDEDYYFSKAI
jgi:deoxyinosine 3'endonuclease (endonuclease V)